MLLFIYMLIHFLKIDNIADYNNLTKIFAFQAGSLWNVNEIASTLGISNKTVSKYIDILEGTYVFKRVQPFSRNIRKEISKMPKYELITTAKQAKI